MARIGGEELVVVVPRPSTEIAGLLRAALHNADIHPGLTVSMGISDSNPESCTGAESLWRWVGVTDAAMYQAKQAGRDRIARVPAEQTDRLIAPDPDGWPPPRAGLLPSTPTAVNGAGCDDPPLDYRLFGAFSVVFAGIGGLAYPMRVAINQASAWAPVFVVLVAVVAGFGIVAMRLGRRLPAALAMLTILALELCTIAAVLATDLLENRIMIICAITVPVLVAAHSVSRRVLGLQYVLVFLGCGLAAWESGKGFDAIWFHRSLSLAVVLGAAPAVLFWLRGRRAAATARLTMLTATDPLTGVSNRGGLECAVLAGDPDQPVQVLGVNINGFKALNDSRGHVHGDKALALLAETLSTAVREHERTQRRTTEPVVPPAAVARIGGDRFVVVGRTRLDQALIARIRRAVAVMPIQLSVSMGQARGRASTSAELWTLIAEADAQLARTKRHH